MHLGANWSTMRGCPVPAARLRVGARAEWCRTVVSEEDVVENEAGDAAPSGSTVRRRPPMGRGAIVDPVATMRSRNFVVLLVLASWWA